MRAFHRYKYDKSYGVLLALIHTMISPGALAVYSHLLCCMNRKACHQDWLSHRAIGRAVKMSANTIHKYMPAISPQ